MFGTPRARYPDTEDQGPFTLAAGTYVLTLDPSDDTVPIYAFQLREVVDGTGTFGVGDVVDGSIATPGGTNTLTVTLAATTEVYLDLQVGASTLYWSLVGPGAGQAIFKGKRARYPDTEDRIATDADGDALTFGLLASPAGMSIDAASGLIVWLPAKTDAGGHTVQVEVLDCCGGIDTQLWTLVVVNDETPPTVVITSTSEPTCLTQPVTFCVQASDDTGVAGTALSIGAEAQTLTGGCVAAVYDAEQTLALVATATDSAGNVGTIAKDHVIEDCTDPEQPVVTLLSPPPDSVISSPTDIVATVSDNKPEKLSWTVSIAPVGTEAFTVIASGDGAVDDGLLTTLDPTTMANGSYRVQLLADDGLNTGGVEFIYNVAGDLKLGNFSATFTDLVVPVGGIPLSVARTYNSLDTVTPSDFGKGWTFTLSGRVVDTSKEIPKDDLIGLLSQDAFTLSSRVTVTKPNGQRVGFTFDPSPVAIAPFQWNPGFKADEGVDDTLQAIGPTSLMAIGGKFYEFIVGYNPDVYLLTTKEGVKYTISELDGLQKIEDVSGNTIEVTPDGIVSSLGISLTFERDAQGRITTIWEPSEPGSSEPPGSVVYGYDGVGNLVSVTDQAGAETTLHYEQPGYPHYLTKIVDPLGRPVTRNVFDDDGLLIGQCGPGGDITTLDGCTVFDHDSIGGSSTFVNARGFRTDLFYDTAGRILAERRFTSAAEYLETSYTYDAAGNELTRKLPDGSAWSYTYDAQGRQTSKTDSGGNTWTQQFGSCDDPELECDPLGSCTERVFDDACRVSHEIDPLGGARQYKYDAKGQYTDLWDAQGNHWQFIYDALGRPTHNVDPQGNVTQLSINSALELLYIIDGEGRKMSYTYDKKHRVTQEVWDTDPPTVTTYTYDLAGNVIGWESPDSKAVVTYWPTGLVKTVTTTGVVGAPGVVVTYGYLDGATLEPGYDANGNVTHVMDSLGGVTTYAYDALDRLVTVTQSGEGVADKRIDQTYDPASLAKKLTRNFGITQ